MSDVNGAVPLNLNAALCDLSGPHVLLPIENVHLLMDVLPAHRPGFLPIFLLPYSSSSLSARKFAEHSRLSWRSFQKFAFRSSELSKSLPLTGTKGA